MDRPRRPDAINPSSKKLLTCWVDNPQPRGFPQMNWGRTLKVALLKNDLPAEFSNGTRLRLIEIDGVLFVVLKCRAQQRDTDLLTKRHLG
jgi:hypothetical protein